jgi:chlorite dismutase
MPNLMVSFAGSRQGTWRVERIQAVTGATLDAVESLAIVEGASSPPPDAVWVLRGVTSYDRYVNRREHETLAAIQEDLGRPGSTRAALIPIRKLDSWWALPQDERRDIFEERSHHIATGLEYLPAVDRRLHHGRDLGEPFDFLTWFEYAPDDADRFEQLVRRLRATEEWSYVVREIDVRLVRDTKGDEGRR